METKFQDQLVGIVNSFLSYLPDLLGGIILLLIGWLAGWIAQKLLVQFSIILRIDRLFRRSRYESGFEKADIRYGLYNFIGNIGFLIIFLIIFFAIIGLLHLGHYLFNTDRKFMFCNFPILLETIIEIYFFF